MAFRPLLPSVFGARAGSDPFVSLQDEINRLFSDFGRGWPIPANGKIPLALDIAETDKSVEVTAEVPGVEAKDIDVSIRDGLLTIKGRKESCKDDKTDNFHLVERTYGAFERSVQLPAGVDDQHIEAKFDKGVLHISLPKSPEAQVKTRKIAVKQAA